MALNLVLFVASITSEVQGLCKVCHASSLFIYQYEIKDENENQSFRLYVLKQTCDERTHKAL